MQGDQAQVNIKFLNVVFYINLLLGMLTLNIILKGVMHGDYTWGYHRKPLDYPLS